jgi:hypothetical protein
MKFIGQLLAQHLSRYPQAGLADIYKLLHQAALGPAHAVDRLAARERLEAEADTLGDGPAEPLTDPISPDGRLARIHLRPYVARGLDLGALADALAETATTWPASFDKLARFCGCLGDLADAAGIPFARADVVKYMRAREDEGWPAVRHSDAFRTAYRPAYRVIDIDLLQDLAL